VPTSKVVGTTNVLFQGSEQGPALIMVRRCGLRRPQTDAPVFLEVLTVVDVNGSGAGASDMQGHLTHCYKGSLLGWLNDGQRDHFLNKGLVERVEDSTEVPKLPADETITECVGALARLGVPATAGAPKARSALRDSGHKYSNETVAQAIRQRKAVHARQKGSDDEDFEEIVAS
jgi:hypothetical protein